MTERPENSRELQVYASDLVAGELDFTAGEAFWARIEELVAGQGESHLDAVMGGKPAPRTWVILHAPGRGELSTAVVMSLARELASRDQSAIVLDADETQGALTAWIGRTEKEGWIDLARYGTSVLTSGLTLPFEGRRGYVLGVGSFTPTDVTAEEIKALMARLRRQADDVMVVAPADKSGLAWAQEADARILCWDPATLSAVENETLATPFAANGTPVTAVVACGEIPPAGIDAPEDRIVEEVFSENEEEVPDHEGFPEQDVVADTTEPDAPDPREVDDEGVEDDPWRESGSIPYPEEPKSGRGTSAVFWFGAVGALVVIVVAFVYWFKVLRVPSEGHFENLPAMTQVEDTPVPTSRPVIDEVDTADEELTAGVDTGSDAEPGGEAVLDTTAAAADLPREASPGPDTEPEVAEKPVVDETAGDETAEAFDMGPYNVPVGRDGWALHVYSLPSYDALQEQLKELERRRFKTAVKAVDVEGKGRWYRVYLGNFASRNEARTAEAALMAKLGTDYAAPMPFESQSTEQSAPESD